MFQWAEYDNVRHTDGDEEFSSGSFQFDLLFCSEKFNRPLCTPLTDDTLVLY